MHDHSMCICVNHIYSTTHHCFLLVHYIYSCHLIYMYVTDMCQTGNIPCFGERERPNYSARQSVFHLRSCFLFILCAHNLSTDLLIVSMHEKPNGILIWQEIEYIVIYAFMEHSAGTGVSLSSAVSVARRSLLRTTCISSSALG